MTVRSPRAILPFLLVTVGACASAPGLSSEDELSIRKVEPGKEDSSAEAVFVDFTFDGELLTPSSWNAERQIETQLLYTIGHLNGDRAVGRLDQVELSDVRTETVEGGVRVSYTAKLPVAWGQRDAVPSTYKLTLPLDVSSSALTEFATQYGHDCVDRGAHDVDSGSMWYYYRPHRSNCALAAEDVVEVEADLTPSASQTTGRFPEYDEVWKDGVLRITAVFGKYEDGATTSSDAGISAYGRFVDEMKRVLAPFNPTTVPSTLSGRPGVEIPEVRFSATLDSEHQVELVALLVDNVRTAGAEFDARYAELSGASDLITYNGHAGLGSNIRALAGKGRWVTGQYAIVFMNGCDTYAYVDSALWDAHAAVNADDPEGTKYLDLISNALPSYFRSMPRATLALIDGLMAYDEPRTYEQIFADIDSQQVVLVSGEHDNDYTPGGGEEPPPSGWDGMNEAGDLARGEQVRFETPTLAAGTYVFDMNGSGDADLYVRIGAEPTLGDYDCRPYRANSTESCTLDLAAPATVHLLIDGYSASHYELVGQLK